MEGFGATNWMSDARYASFWQHHDVTRRWLVNLQPHRVASLPAREPVEEPVVEETPTFIPEVLFSRTDGIDDDEDGEEEYDENYQENDDEMSEEYKEFQTITRVHQAERDARRSGAARAERAQAAPVHSASSKAQALEAGRASVRDAPDVEMISWDEPDDEVPYVDAHWNEAEMSEEYKEFHRKTRAHQEERDARRAAAARTERAQAAAAMGETGDDEAAGQNVHSWIRLDDNDGYVDVAKIGVDGVQKRTFAAPNAPAEEAARKAAAEVLYGTNAPTILALETALDMQFRAAERGDGFSGSAPLWPVIPLNL